MTMIFYLTLLLNFLHYECLLIPWIIGGIATLVPTLYNFSYLSCKITECCVPHSKWLPMNLTKLDEHLKNNLFGQPLVDLSLMRQLKNHVNNLKPSKALLLSFNGMPGTGKNYVSNMIAESFYWNGMKNNNVKFYVSSHHFPPGGNIDRFKDSLKSDIIEIVKRCPYSLFIFDEVHEMPPSLLDVLKPFVDSYDSLDGVDYRHAIFILLSNSGARDITGELFEAWKNGLTREQLTIKQVEEALAKNLYNMENDGLRQSKLIRHNLISAYVPFLPLEKKHVRQCLGNLLLLKHRHSEDNELIELVLNELSFETHNGFQWAMHGCKRIEDKLNLFL